ncbi:TetR/AcrR family transcriptional regulator [Geoalkalibacter halelectricus]|uniref:TetR/AcrR family transcriptional regulator n=1 Tax=Geoalkalibacter halelectricus TaxID=2847045 RepID=A0ABY5ZLW2_9BACT|nr:TetR/AcrR family transcriptional regulator [Geoalkalibacter halelectricus]MDO3376865.1 TetR/AcrR family transcriptional regulator [Geoalkalibacter halelectricus]UWZ79613.1 TetR/AcrR family transcriptional regulator [Geoalkalibacter halelectricus]
MPSKGERTRQKILQEAGELFRTKGFGATSVSDLLEATGVTKGSLYFHFPGKDDLGLEYLRQSGERFMRFIDEGLDGRCAGEKLDGFLSQAFAYHRGRGFVGGCLFGNTALETSDTAPEFAQITTQVFVRWKEKLAAIIAQAQNEGTIHQGRSAEDLAEFVIAVLEGGIMQSRLHKSEEPMKNCIETLRQMLFTNNPGSEKCRSRLPDGEKS